MKSRLDLQIGFKHQIFWWIFLEILWYITIMAKGNMSAEIGISSQRAYKMSLEKSVLIDHYC